MYSLAGVIIGILFLIGLWICGYWAKSEEKKHKGKGPLSIILLSIMIGSCASPAGVITRKKYAGYRVVKIIPVDKKKDLTVIESQKEFVEIYTPFWWKDVYQVGDTIK